MQWSLLLFACSWSGRPRGRGDQLSTCLFSTASWTFHTSAWRPSSLFSVSPSGGLDGLHRPSGSVSSGSCPSRISSLPPLCGAWSRLPVQSDVFWSLHGPAGLHTGYGSCVSVSSFHWYPYASLPGRLAPLGSRGCPVPLSRARDSRQPGEVQLLPVSGGSVSRGGYRCAVFYGFSVAGLRLQAQINSWRISALRRASRQLVAVAAGDVLSVPFGSRGPSANAVAPDLPLPLLGSAGSFDPGGMVSGLSSGTSVVALRGSSLSRGSLRQVSPDLDFWSDASDVGWGAHLGDQVASGLWARSEALLPINARELLAVHQGLLHFQSFLSGATVAVFCDNVTAVAYLRKEGGTKSSALNAIA